MGLDWAIVARAVHVVAVVVWIGSVWLVTTVLLPTMRRKPPDEWRREFAAIEHRLAPQARIAVVLVLLSGLYMSYEYDLWDRFALVEFWWMDLMVGVWVLFAFALFVIEPLVAWRATHRHIGAQPAPTLSQMLWLHRVLLLLSIAAVLAAVAGSHGLL